MSSVHGVGYSPRTIPGGGGPPSPPFAPGSGANGLSVDPISGAIVWGNDVTGLPGAAALTSNREIDTAGFSMRLFDSTLLPADFSTIIGADDIQLFEGFDHAALRGSQLHIEDTITGDDMLLDNVAILFNDVVNGFLSSFTASQLRIQDSVNSLDVALDTINGLAFLDNINSLNANYSLTNFALVNAISGNFLTGSTSQLLLQNASGDNSLLTALQLQILAAATNAFARVESSGFTVDDGSQFNARLQGNRLAVNDSITGISTFVDPAIITLTSATPASDITLENATALRVNFNGASVFEANDTTGLKSIAVPGGTSGSGEWALGNVVVTPSVFNANQYVEISINGVVTKLACVT